MNSQPSVSGVPQPHVSRITPFSGHGVVVGVTPGQSELVMITAARWAQSLGGVTLHLGWCAPELVVVQECPDGQVRTAPRDPDTVDDSWQQRAEHIQLAARRLIDPLDVPWKYYQLAGRPDRALTHLARAVDAAVFVVGARPHRSRRTLADFFGQSTAVHLAHHQHRPVLVVPVDVVDWEDRSLWK